MKHSIRLGPLQFTGGFRGYLDGSGQVAFILRCDELWPFHGQYACFRRGNHLGFVDRLGIEVIEPFLPRPESNEVGLYFSGGLCRVQWGHNDYGFIMPDGREALGRRFPYATDFAMEWACVEAEKDKLNLIDKRGDVIHSLNDCVIEPFIGLLPQWSWKMFPVKVKDAHGQYRVMWKNFKDEALFPARYLWMSFFCDGVAGFYDEGVPPDQAYGLVNLKQEIVMSPRFFDLGEFSEGWARVGVRKHEHGHINAEGRFLSPPQFDRTGGFSEGRACVMKNRRHGFISAQGDMVIPMQFAHEASFHEGTAFVEFTDSAVGFINRNGDILWRGSSPLVMT